MKAPFSIDTALVGRFVPIVVPLVVLLTIYAAAVVPRGRAARASLARVLPLKAELANMRSLLQAPAEPAPPSASSPSPGEDAVRMFGTRVPSENRVPELLEALAQRALAVGPGEIRNLLIETGERVDMGSPAAGAGPRVAGGANERPDPRFALFPQSLAYTPITVSFESAYSRAGEFLWRLRDLPTTIEIRSLELKSVSAETSQVRAALTILAFQRIAASADEARAIARTPLP